MRLLGKKRCSPYLHGSAVTESSDLRSTLAGGGGATILPAAVIPTQYHRHPQRWITSTGGSLSSRRRRRTSATSSSGRSRASWDRPSGQLNRVRISCAGPHGPLKPVVTLSFLRPENPTDNAANESVNASPSREYLSQHWFLKLADASGLLTPGARSTLIDGHTAVRITISQSTSRAAGDSPRPKSAAELALIMVKDKMKPSCSLSSARHQIVKSPVAI